jgi:parallel beta-helix repeat protein
LVTNGAYTGGVVLNQPLALRSVNGPQFTVINGLGRERCVFLPSGANVSGFTLTRGMSSDNGGGVFCVSATAVVSNCVLTGNSAQYAGGGAAHGTLVNCLLNNNSAGLGGGVAWGDTTLNNCTLTGNSASDSGGGAYLSTLNNCTLTGNRAQDGGGALDSTLNNCTVSGNSAAAGGGAENSTLNNCTLTGNSANAPYGGGGALDSTLNNCIAYFNTAPVGANYDSYSTLSYCCTTPQPPSGAGNITLDPLFVNRAGGNLRLQSNSPCINAGNNVYVVGSTDLDGRPRIVGGTADMGAYEFQGPGLSEFIGWLQQYGLPTDGSADYADPDHDRMNNWQEWIAGTDPTNPSSALKMLAPVGLTSAPGITVTWQSVSGVTYFLERSTDLGNPPAFSLLQTNIPGQPDTTTYTDTNAVGPGPFFYRAGVGN